MIALVALMMMQSTVGATAAQPPDEDGFADIVVTARPGPLPPLRDAIEYYRDYCLEANRLSGRSAPPVPTAPAIAPCS